MDPQSPQRKTHSYRAGFLIVLVGVLLMAMMLWVYDSLGTADLNRAVLQANSLGGPLTLDDLMKSRRKWPEGQNGADLIIAVQSELQTEALKNVEGLPILDFRVKPELGRRWSPEMLEQVQRYLDKARPQIEQIDKLGQYEGGAFPLTIAADPSTTLLPNLGPLRNCARLKSLQARCRVMEGDTSRLVNDVDVLMRHSRLVADDPTLISVLVAIACDGLALQTIESGLSIQPLSPDDLQRLQQMLVVPDVQARLEWSVRSERAFFLAAADYFRSTGTLPGSGGGSVFPALRIPGAQGWVMKDEARGLAMFNRLLSAGDAGKMRQTAKTIEMEIASQGRLGVLTQNMMPSFSRAMGLITQNAAEIACARVGLAAERYRLHHGRWPSKPGDLVPDYIDRIPDDPFTGKPVRMIARDGRFVAYSVGMDELDNRGRILRDGRQNDSPDCGFILLDPERRNQPPPPETAPAPDSQPAQ